MARDRPSPYGKERDLLHPTVARGPVPRDPSGKPKTIRSPEPPAVSVTSDAWRGTGPRPTGRGTVLA